MLIKKTIDFKIGDVVRVVKPTHYNTNIDGRLAVIVATYHDNDVVPTADVLFADGDKLCLFQWRLELIDGQI